MAQLQRLTAYSMKIVDVQPAEHLSLINPEFFGGGIWIVYIPVSEWSIIRPVQSHSLQLVGWKLRHIQAFITGAGGVGGGGRGRGRGHWFLLSML
jgi:hypothetical protein